MKSFKIVDNKNSIASIEDFEKGYLSTLQLIQSGEYELAAESAFLNSIDSETENTKILKMLINFRLALKANSIPLDGKCQLSYINTYDKKLLAEIHLVNGAYFFNCKLYEKAMSSFNESKSLFKELKFQDKYFLAFYNFLMCEINLSEGLMKTEHFNKLLLLQNEAEDFNNKNILGLICRQKSYFFKENLKWNAALSEAERAVLFLESTGSRTDFQFALLNIADCFLELKLVQKAKAAFERIIPPIDSRVDFAYRFIEALINLDFNEKKMTIFNPRKDADPHFLYRAELKLSQLSNSSEISIANQPCYFWSKNKGVFKNLTQEWVIQPDSREFVLLNLLIEGPKSTDYIIKILWPFYAERSQLVNRLYSLISKVNKKFNGLIIRSNGKYEIYGKIIFE